MLAARKPTCARTLAGSLVTSNPAIVAEPLVGLEERGQQAQRGGLAGAVGAEQAVDLAGVDAKRDIVGRANLAALFVAERFGEVVGFDHLRKGTA